MKLVAVGIGPDAFKHNCFLRDADGNLTFIARKGVDASQQAKLTRAAKTHLGTYVTDTPVATPDELFDEQLKDKSKDKLEYVVNGKLAMFVRLVERRVVGQDWVRGIWSPIDGVPPIVVFASHKGGVGRSTALAVAATDFARRGYSILAVDTDLEAPGLGEMFIRREKQPRFGTLDYFVENGRGTIDREFLINMRARSLTTPRRGSVHVVPAVGSRCREFPQNVIGKISRAYLEDAPNEEGAQLTLLEQMRCMFKDLCKGQRYDAIFVDARAGLNETTAATVQGLGADILFFGVDTPQTWDGYRYFLAHLARFKPTTGESDWRFRLKMVHAKATHNPAALAAFRDNAFGLFAEHLYDEVDESAQRIDQPFGFDLDDSEAPHYAWPIAIDTHYYEFDPVTHPEQLSREEYQKCFGEFIQKLADRLRLK